jgi:hypothetical protein
MEMQTPSPPPKNSQNPDGKMSPVDILAKSVKGKEDPNQLHMELTQLVNSDPNFRIMRANNSLFLYRNQGNGEAKIMLETADDPRKLVESFKEFSQAMKKANFKTLKFDVSNPDIVRVIKMAGGQPKMAGVAGQKMTGVVEI